MKKLKKIAFSASVGVMLFGGALSPLVVNASSTNTNLRVTLDASRPLIGNARGTSTATTRTSNTSGVQARMYITNTNNTSTTTAWTSAQLIGPVTGINSGVSRTSPQATATTRNGIMRGQGRTRNLGANGNWSAPLSHTINWN